MSTEQQQLHKLEKFITRNLRLILICLFCGMMAGLAWYLQSPKNYKATALIMYQQQQVNPTTTTKKSPDVQARLLEMVNTVSQQVTSRNNLEEIVKKHDLYHDLRQKMPMEDVLESMRSEDITIEPLKGADVFQVSFVGDNPRQVMLVANALASKFIEENIRFREKQVSETSAYIKDELAMAKTSLDKQEEGMRDFKLQYYNEMPEQQTANIARLNTLQTQDQSIQNNLQDQKRTQLLIQEQIGLRKMVLSQLSTGQAGILLGEKPASELESVRQQLEMSRSRYTDNHPDVRRLQKRLAVLQEAQGGADGGREQKEVKANGGSIENVIQDKQLSQLDLQLKEINISVARLQRDQETARRQIAQVQQWLEATPVREAQWASLTRDYSQLQQHYQTLVSRNLEAESAELLERRQKGSQFKIIEPALFPSKPFSPDFLKFMLIAIVLGLGMGVGLAFVLEFLDTSFRNINDLETYLGVPVACIIPVLQTTSEKKRLRQLNVAWSVALSVGFALLGSGMLLLWHRGLIIL